MKSVYFNFFFQMGDEWRHREEVGIKQMLMMLVIHTGPAQVSWVPKYEALSAPVVGQQVRDAAGSTQQWKCSSHHTAGRNSGGGGLSLNRGQKRYHTGEFVACCVVYRAFASSSSSTRIYEYSLENMTSPQVRPPLSSFCPALLVGTHGHSFTAVFLMPSPAFARKGGKARIQLVVVA